MAGALEVAPAASMMLMKKKRGRPRKYRPYGLEDGAISDADIFFKTTAGIDFLAGKHAKEQPTSLVSKAKFEVENFALEVAPAASMMLMKKKRGRPRKYRPYGLEDGAISDANIFFKTTVGIDFLAGKHAKEQPTSLVSKAKFEVENFALEVAPVEAIMLMEKKRGRPRKYRPYGLEDGAISDAGIFFKTITGNRFLSREARNGFFLSFLRLVEKTGKIILPNDVGALSECSVIAYDSFGGGAGNNNDADGEEKRSTKKS
ncbi:AT-hook motif nuclear-localized protein 1 [Senna tora]|uniref:AT-hook motif nuclear-localized protein 1 n=1 Tax=Senna tora TaxID=362788 RepID=A0A834U2N6_9FABA|nr:AT-hook motif nuclear-localized protein 1 [Senna tora]